MEDSRTRNSMRNIAFSIGSKILTILMTFVSRSIFLYCLSVDYLGIQGLFSDILTMLSLADLGFASAMSFSMYKPLAEKDNKKLAALTCFYGKVYKIIALVITGVGLALVPFLKYIVNTDTEIPHLTVYYLLYLANTVSSYLVIYKTTIITADQKGYILTKFGTIFNIISTICSCAFLLLTKNYIVYLSVKVLFTYVVNFYCSRVAEKRYPFINEKEQLSKYEKKELAKTIGSGFIYKITGVVLSGTDNILISVLIGTAVIGYYSNYTVITNQLSAITNILFYSLTASLGNLAIKESKSRKYEVFNSIQTLSFIVGTFCAVCVITLEQDFIRVWLGQDYLLDMLSLIALVVNFYFSTILYPVRVYRDATGLYRKTQFVMLATAVLNLVLSIIMGKVIGLAGILFATSISKLLTFFWYEPLLLFKQHFGISSFVYFKQMFFNLILTVIVVVVAYYGSSFVNVTGWFTLILRGIIVAFIAGIVVILAYYKSSGMKELRMKFNAILKGILRKKTEV